MDSPPAANSPPPSGSNYGEKNVDQTKLNREPAANSAGGRAATKAGAYGGSEVGSMVGHLVGPPVIGGIIGNIVGEKVGERAAKGAGLDRLAGQMNDDLAKAVGKSRADKVGDIALTAMGYSDSEYCICCPCLPASQTLYLVMMLFFVFNCYRLGVGIEFEAGCTRGANQSVVVEVEDGSNDTDVYLGVVGKDDTLNVTTYLVSYPCEFGFHYLVSGAAVWIAFLPFYICSLFGNCYRQCCCCLCDPVVCTATAMDFVKRCCCECGKFSCVDFVWYSMCIFQLIWGLFGLHWLATTLTNPAEDHLLYDYGYQLIPCVIAAVVLDLLLSGSELVHKARIVYLMEARKKTNEEVEMERPLN